MTNERGVGLSPQQHIEQARKRRNELQLPIPGMHIRCQALLGDNFATQGSKGCALFRGQRGANIGFMLGDTFAKNPF